MNEGNDFLSALDERIRQIAAHVFAEQQAQSAPAAEEWLTVARAAEIAGVSQWTVREASRKGDLQADRPRPRCVRIRRAELRRWMQKEQASACQDVIDSAPPRITE